MKAPRMLVGLGAALVGMAWLPAQPASADNTAAFRDCSFVGGFDPDFVELSGAKVDSQGKLSVTPTQNQVTLTASESSDPGDSMGHDTFTVTVSAPDVPARRLSGAGTGRVVLSVPLAGAAVGSVYTISWSATFDNGNHACPSSATPQNTGSMPFVLNVVANSPMSTPPTVTRVRQSHRAWRESGVAVSPSRKPRPPVGTTFSFILNERASVRFAFMRRQRGRRVIQGTRSFAGHTGLNRVPFGGRISSSRKLKPGRFTLVITAADRAAQRSQPRSISFTIVR
jgi:hypothetical protein